MQNIAVGIIDVFLVLLMMFQPKSQDVFDVRWCCSLCETNQIHKICEGKAQKPDGKYSCDKCDFTTNNQNYIKHHNEAVHLKTKNFRCSACVFVKFKKEEIRRHIKLKHKNETCRAQKRS